MTRNYGPDELDNVNWETVCQPSGHAFRLRVTPVALYKLDTGEEVARSMPGFRFAWIHDHVHMVPASYQLEDDGTVIKTQVATKIAELDTSSLATLGGFMVASKLACPGR